MNSQKWIYLGLLVMVVALVFCHSPEPSTPLYRNLTEEVSYVGMEACQSCHDNVHRTFIHTGMGRSFDRASRLKSAATYDTHSVVYDEKSNFYYQPFWKDSSLYIKEFRLAGKDTIFKRIEQVDYIVGSGQHTNSHIISENGYIYQAPITFYTQDGHWDLAPGFEKDNLRFSRFLTTECITCHNHYPDYIQGSLNKFAAMPTGIECERCHGPGSLHVEEKQAGILVDTATQIDYSIVNPRDLPRNLQMDLCQRCHLQGVAVLKEGKSFFDFKPGMPLNEVMNVFLPRYSNSHEKFIMASQADRLRKSPCYLQSEKLSCITCHNPHISIEATEQSRYNQQCQSCHQQKKCTETEPARLAADNDCVSCHMPPSGSIDIPHVRITDHYISKETAKRGQPIDKKQQDLIATFLGLDILTKPKGSPLEMAQGYLALYDKYTPAPDFLDSIESLLRISKASLTTAFKTRVHYAFIREDYKGIVELATQVSFEQIRDDWTYYRIGESYLQLSDLPKAKKYMIQATELAPYTLEFHEKLGIVFIQLEQLELAAKTFNYVLKENSKRPVALCNLGYVNVLQHKFSEAETLYNAALRLDPDYEQALLNKAAVRLAARDKKEARQLINRVLDINPDNEMAQAALEMIEK